MAYVQEIFAQRCMHVHKDTYIKTFAADLLAVKKEKRQQKTQNNQNVQIGEIGKSKLWLNTL